MTACGHLGEQELQQKLLEFLEHNPFSDEIILTSIFATLIVFYIREAANQLNSDLRLSYL
ncbi:hypothetical protein B5G37_03030 [Pseudoflavonifractor sp. An85]|nr:hypothetical protein B5G37_03030 [Pseudoflavonifractor sp. An85]